MKEKTKKKILLVLLCAVTLLILFAAIRLNANRKNSMLSSSLIKGYLSEIKYEEIITHVKEQPNTVVYVSDSSDEKSMDFEKKFIKVVKKYNLENEIIYININGVTIVDPLYQNAPELVFYKNGEMSDLIDCTTMKSTSVIIEKLKERSVIND